ncbi:MAG: hypothetical protein U5K56_13625 [Halioglobus sp.]|nr:hypothetical protein [Halioglobus sp.]
MSETIFPDAAIELFGWHIPLADAEIRNRRVGLPFWSEFETTGGSATVLRVPVTFPPDNVDHMIAGMGVPDLLGTQGTYTLYSTRPLSGGESGRVVYMKAGADGRIDTALAGPPHPLKKPAEPLETPLELYPAEGGTGHRPRRTRLRPRTGRVVRLGGRQFQCTGLYQDSRHGAIAPAGRLPPSESLRLAHPDRPAQSGGTHLLSTGLRG